jgi:hypothetical protein
MKYYLDTSLKEERNVIFAVADLCKLSVFDGTRNHNNITGYPLLLVNLRENTTGSRVTGSCVSLGDLDSEQVVTMSEMIALMYKFTNDTVTVVLNKQYSARIKKEDGSVAIGCQTFCKETIMNFIKEYNKAIK